MLKENEEFRGFEIRMDKGGTLCAVFQRPVEAGYFGVAAPLATASIVTSPEEWCNEGALVQRIQGREVAGHDVSMSNAALVALHKRKAELTP